MNELSLMDDFVVALFNADNLVHTITEVKTDEIDLNKENIYALVNLDMIESEVLEDAVVVSYTITIVQQRLVIPRKTDSKLMRDTNYRHNINETHSIAQRFINVLLKQNNDENVEIETLSKIEILKDWRSGLDGVQFEADLTIPNIGRSC